MLTFNPRAKFSSLPLNQTDTIADCATLIHSPPNANKILPNKSITYDSLYPPIANTNYPRDRIKQNITKPRLIPILSNIIPPKSGRNIFGSE